MVSVNPEVVRKHLKLLEALEAALEWSIVNRYDILAKTHTIDTFRVKAHLSIPYSKQPQTFKEVV